MQLGNDERRIVQRSVSSISVNLEVVTIRGGLDVFVAISLVFSDTVYSAGDGCISWGYIVWYYHLSAYGRRMKNVVG